MHRGILSVGIENRGHWPWPSRSFWPFWLRMVGNLACPRDNSSQMWARITKYAPNMHHGMLSAGIENGGHWPWPSSHFDHFDSEFYELRLVCAATFNGFELESQNLHQICILGFLRLVLKMGSIDLDLQGHLATSTHKTAFSVALVHWSRSAKGCYTSQTCSCYSRKCVWKCRLRNGGYFVSASMC